MSRHHHTRPNKRGWERIRRWELERAGRLEVHHVEPLAAGGTNDQRLAVVCRVCHLSEHQRPDPARDAWREFMREQIAC